MDFSKRNGFKETEIGTIPEDWEVTKLENLVLDKIGGEWGTENKESPEEIGCYVLRGTDFSKAAVGKFDNVPFRYVKNKIYEKKKLEEGEVLVELSGGSKDQPTGRIFLITYDLMKDTSKTILFSNFVKKLKLKKTAVYPEYFYRYWQFLYNQGKTSVYEKRTTGIRNFKYNDFLENEFIPLPPLPEQKKIAAVLSAVQEAKEKAEAVIKATKELKKSLMKHLFTYGPVSPKEAGNVALKETEIGMIPEDWEVKRLGDCLQKTKQKDMRKTTEEFYYIDVSSIDRDYLRIISVTKYKGKNAPSRARKIVKENDVIIAIVRPTLKRVALIPKKYDNQVCSTAFCVLRGDEGIDNRFIYYTIQRDTFINALGNIQRGASYPAVTDSDVKNQKIPLPPLPIQQKIAEILSAVDEKIEAEENKKKSLEDLFKTLLNNLMTGKIRVNNLEV